MTWTAVDSAVAAGDGLPAAAALAVVGDLPGAQGDIAAKLGQPGPVGALLVAGGVGAGGLGVVGEVAPQALGAVGVAVPQEVLDPLQGGVGLGGVDGEHLVNLVVVVVCPGFGRGRQGTRHLPQHGDPHGDAGTSPGSARPEG